MSMLVRWNPFQELDAAERRIRRVLDDFGVPPALPAADVYETDGEYVFEVEVPGFEERELNVEITDHTLTIKGERTETKEQQEKAYRLHERLSKTFERRFELPAETEPQKIAADFSHGVLTVHAPKAKAAKPHKVAIAAKT